MRSSLDIAPGELGSRDGGGPDDDGRFSSLALRSHGFIALSFGFALGLTCIIFFAIFRFLGAPTTGLVDFVSKTYPNLMLCFIYGFIGGTIIAGIYNSLIFRRFNLFGLDRNMD
jgi:hypothetical protein